MTVLTFPQAAASAGGRPPFSAKIKQMRCLRHLLAGALIVVGATLTGADRAARALAPAETDVLPLVASVDGVSLLAEGSVALTGWARVDRALPHLEDGVQVVDLEIVSLELRGAGQVGLISVVERPDDGPDYVSSGEVRSLQPGEDFPASSFLDLFIDVAVPASPIGALLLHNEIPLHLTPREGGQDVAVDAWPPLAVTYELAPISGEDSACIPLLSSDGAQVELDFCVRNLTLGIAPEWPSYSVARGGPSSLHPADILALTPNVADSSSQAPFVRIRCASLGLTADGCDDGTDGDQDDLDALSYGGDLPASEGPELNFSVGAGAQGVAGSAVEVQRNCPPAQPGASPEAEPDEFGSVLNGTNYHVLDGNGPVGTCSPAFPLGLIEGATVRDDLDALDQQDSSAVDENADGVPESPVYFSLDAASPSLGTSGFSAADVLETVNGGAPTVYVSAAALGLRAGDDLDALCLRESGDDVYGAEDVLYFSLAPGSPTLSQTGAGPGDILAPGSPPTIAQSGLSLGLLATDDTNALKCRAMLGTNEPDGDVNCDQVTDSIDAALVLRHTAGLIDSLVCAQNADVNGDGATDSIDAALILQLDAGLIEHLPLHL